MGVMVLIGVVRALKGGVVDIRPFTLQSFRGDLILFVSL